MADIKPKCEVKGCKQRGAQLIQVVHHHHPENGCKWETANEKHCVYMMCSYHLALAEAKRNE